MAFFLLLTVAVSDNNLFAGLNPRTMRFDRIGTADGLSEGIVTSIAQDSLGLLWFGTADGLNCFDGYAFTRYHHVPTDSGSLGNSYVQSIFIDRRNTLWVGVIGGLDRFDRARGKFEHVLFDPQSNTSTLSIAEDQDGILWFGSYDGVLVSIDPMTGTRRTFAIPHPSGEKLSVSSIAFAGRNDLWVGTWERGTFHFNGSRFTPLTLNGLEKSQTGSQTAFVRALYYDPSGPGTLWIGTEGGGLIAQNHQTGAVKQYLSSPSDSLTIASNTIRVIKEDRGHRFWIGLDGGGLDLLDRRTGEFIHHRKTGSPTSIVSDRVASIFEDRAGNLWLGTWGDGISKYSPGKHKFSLDEALFKASEQLPNKFVLSMRKDSLNRLWIGTHGGGLHCFDLQTGAVHHYTYDPSDPGTISNNTVWTIQQDRSGAMWIGTEFGMSRLDPTSGRAERFVHENTNPASIKANSVTATATDRDGRIWAATLSGVDVIDPAARPRRFHHLGYLPTTNAEPVPLTTPFIFIDRAGKLWFYRDGIQCADLGRPGIVPAGGQGRQQGKTQAGDERLVTGVMPIIIDTVDTENDGLSIRRYPVRTYTFRSPSEGQSQFNSMTEDHAGNLWLGSFGGGLCRLNPNSGEYQFYTTVNGSDDNHIPDDYVYGALEDHKGFIWVSTNSGLARLDPRDRTFRSYRASNGLQSDEFNRGSYFKAADGQLFFGGINGFNAFYPDSIFDTPLPPPVIITGFLKFNEPASFGKPISEVGTINLTYRDNYFSFEFAGLDYTEPSLNRYAYRLEGLDNRWVMAGTRRFASFTNLDPGNYVFHVKAANSDGLWNDQGVSVVVSIAPPFWRTWWAYTLYVITLCGAGAGIRWLAQNWKIVIANRKARHIAHYRLGEKLGEGGMGTVYKAVDGQTGREVAVKLLNPALLNDPENRKRLAAEGRLLSSFNHPHILRVFETGESSERAYIAMELLRGGTLRGYLDRLYPLPEEEFYRLISQVASGLAAIHAQGIIHRDLKTANIMLDEHCNVRIMDFGLSKSPLVTMMTSLGTVIGTLGYVAPEQITNISVDHRVDIFSLGVIMYEMLTNTIPFKGENEMAVIHALFNTHPLPPSSLKLSSPGTTKTLDLIIMKCLQKDVEKRYQTVNEIIEALGHEKQPK